MYLPTRMSTTTTRNIGYVKWFNKKQGFGFIHVLNGEMLGKDIFVHYSAIRVKDQLQQYKYLIQGEYVEFVVEQSVKENHKHHAVDITGIMEHNILCDTQSALRVNRNYE